MKAGNEFFDQTGGSKINDFSSLFRFYEAHRSPSRASAFAISNRQFYEAASSLIRRLQPTGTVMRLLTYGPRLVNVNLCTRAGARGFLVTAAAFTSFTRRIIVLVLVKR